MKNFDNSKNKGEIQTEHRGEDREAGLFLSHSVLRCSDQHLKFGEEEILDCGSNRLEIDTLENREDIIHRVDRSDRRLMDSSVISQYEISTQQRRRRLDFQEERHIEHTRSQEFNEISSVQYFDVDSSDHLRNHEMINLSLLDQNTHKNQTRELIQPMLSHSHLPMSQIGIQTSPVLKGPNFFYHPSRHERYAVSLRSVNLFQFFSIDDGMLAPPAKKQRGQIFCICRIEW